jgi:hypothetical protein
LSSINSFFFCWSKKIAAAVNCLVVDPIACGVVISMGAREDTSRTPAAFS